jgi:fatty-acyl-CoA synthase
MTTVAELIRAQAANTDMGLLYEDQQWSYVEYVQACAQRAAWLLEQRRESPAQAEHFHVGVLLDNVPEYLMWLGASALAGATLVGLNPTRRGTDLERDIRHTECQFVISNDSYWPALLNLDLQNTRGCKLCRHAAVPFQCPDVLRVAEAGRTPGGRLGILTSYTPWPRNIR